MNILWGQNQWKNRWATSILWILQREPTTGLGSDSVERTTPFGWGDRENRGWGKVIFSEHFRKILYEKPVLKEGH